MIRSIDHMDGNLLIGGRNGTIYHCGMESGDQKEIMHSHNDGEVWGLDKYGEGTVVTSGDDNQVIVWDIEKHCRKNVMIVSDIAKKNA